jgi:hypothetical protein
LANTIAPERRPNSTFPTHGDSTRADMAPLRQVHDTVKMLGRAVFLIGLTWMGLACGGMEAPVPAAPLEVTSPTDPSSQVADPPPPESTAASPTKPKSLWLVVSATATNKEQAKEMRKHFLANTPGPRGVRVYSTNDLPSLKPGLFLVSPAVANDKETADHLVNVYGKAFEGTYARQVPKGAIEELGFTTFGPVSCGAEWRSPKCAADGQWRALVSISNPELPPDAIGKGMFDGREVRQAELSDVPVVHASLPEQTSVEVSWRGEVVTTVDLTQYAKLGPGSLYLMEGKAPAFMPYRLPHDFDVRTYWG